MSIPSMPARVYSLERDRDRHEVELRDVVSDVEQIRDDVTTLKTRVGMYAALGAALGGGVVSAVAALIVEFAVR